MKEAAYFKGQYHLDSTLKNLTELGMYPTLCLLVLSQNSIAGQEQARLVGKRFAASEQKYDQLTMSTMQRATETANLMMEQMPPVPSRSDSLLEEGAPYPVSVAETASSMLIGVAACALGLALGAEDEGKRVTDIIFHHPFKDFAVEGSRIEAAFRRYIHRASPRQEKDSRK